MKVLLYWGLGIVALLAVVAIGGEANVLPYLGIAVVALLIYARNK